MTQRRPFSLDSSFKAGRPFVMNGVTYNFDDPVSVQGIEPRRLRQMYDARMIEVVDEAAGIKPAAPVIKIKTPPAPPPEVTPVAEVARGPALRHKGFGRFEVVDAAGKVLAGPLPKEQAERELARMA